MIHSTPGKILKSVTMIRCRNDDVFEAAVYTLWYQLHYSNSHNNHYIYALHSLFQYSTNG